MSNTHRRRRRDETVEFCRVGKNCRVGGVNTPVGSRDPVYDFLCWQLTSDDIMMSLLKQESLANANVKRATAVHV